MYFERHLRRILRKLTRRQRPCHDHRLRDCLAYIHMGDQQQPRRKRDCQSRACDDRGQDAPALYEAPQHDEQQAEFPRGEEQPSHCVFGSRTHHALKERFLARPADDLIQLLRSRQREVGIDVGRASRSPRALQVENCGAKVSLREEVGSKIEEDVRTAESVVQQFLIALASGRVVLSVVGIIGLTEQRLRFLGSVIRALGEDGSEHSSDHFCSQLSIADSASSSTRSRAGSAPPGANLATSQRSSTSITCLRHCSGTPAAVIRASSESRVNPTTGTLSFASRNWTSALSTSA